MLRMNHAIRFNVPCGTYNVPRGTLRGKCDAAKSQSWACCWIDAWRHSWKREPLTGRHATVETCSVLKAVCKKILGNTYEEPGINFAGGRVRQTSIAIGGPKSRNSGNLHASR